MGGEASNEGASHGVTLFHSFAGRISTHKSSKIVSFNGPQESFIIQNGNHFNLGYGGAGGKIEMCLIQVFEFLNLGWQSEKLMHNPDLVIAIWEAAGHGTSNIILNLNHF